MSTAIGEPTIVATIPLHILQVARRYGVDTDAALRKAGITRAQLEDPDGRVPIRDHVVLYQQVVKESKNPALALETGELMSPGSLKVVGHILMTSTTLHEVYNHISRYWSLLTEELSNFTINIVKEGQEERAEIDILFHSRPVHFPKREGIETITSYCMALGREITGHQFTATEVHFPYSEPSYVDRYKEIFGGKLFFDKPHTKIVLAANVIGLATLYPDPLLATALKEWAERRLSLLNEEQNFVRQVRAAIAQHLSTAEFDIATIASHLKIGERTLQRRLQGHGTTFSKTLFVTRREQALQLLDQSDQSVAEIAFLTGYSERSAFERAFKNWTGLTPMKYRGKSVS